jgi:hypothetical protein
MIRCQPIGDTLSLRGGLERGGDTISSWAAVYTRQGFAWKQPESCCKPTPPMLDDRSTWFRYFVPTGTVQTRPGRPRGLDDLQ